MERGESQPDLDISRCRPIRATSFRKSQNMKFIIEVASDQSSTEKLPLNNPLNGKILLVLSPDGKSLTPSGVQLPGLEDLPSLSVVRVTKES